MKIIDLLNMKANDEELPQSILVICEEEKLLFEYNEGFGDYLSEEDNRLIDIIKGDLSNLNDEVKIIKCNEKEDNFTGIKVYENGEEKSRIIFDENSKIKEILI